MDCQLLSYNRRHMPFRLRERWALGFVVAAFVFSTHAFGDDSAPPLLVALDYEVDPQLSDCPSGPDLSAAVSKRLGYDPFISATGPTKHRVKVSIQRTAAGTEAHVEWLDARGGSEGERRLSSESAECGELARGLSFAIAVQIQLRASPEPSAAPPQATPPVPAPAPPAPAPRPARSPESRRLVMVGAGVLAAHGLTPKVSPGLRIFGSVGNQRISLELSTQATLPSEESAEATIPHLSPLASPPSFSAGELSAKVAPCVRLPPFGICGVFMAGQLHVRGEGVDQVRSPSSLVAATGAKLQLVWPPGASFGVLLQAEALALLTPRDVLMNQQVVWSTAPVLLGASLDLAMIFR
jgi:hypothetical protein